MVLDRPGDGARGNPVSQLPALQGQGGEWPTYRAADASTASSESTFMKKERPSGSCVFQGGREHKQNIIFPVAATIFIAV